VLLGSFSFQFFTRLAAVFAEEVGDIDDQHDLAFVPLCALSEGFLASERYWGRYLGPMVRLQWPWPVLRNFWFLRNSYSPTTS